MSDTMGPARAVELVDELASSEDRPQILERLAALGDDALPAVRAGLRHGHWQVRRRCAIYLDHYADVPSLYSLVPLLRDPKSKVRLWAVHSLSCDRCKQGDNPIDVVPLLIERVEVDESIRVRRLAASSLAYLSVPDARVVPVLQALLREEGDEKLRLHAALGLMRCREGGIAVAE